MLSSASCQVYNPDLIDERSASGDIHSHTARDEIRDAAQSESDAAEGDAADGCGDGIVGEGELCDIAIARGNPGACPDGCSGGQGCERNVLQGERCRAHCTMIELTEAASGDGCCPSGASYYADDDCPAHCGNGQIEPGEMCDPAETCPSKTACKSTNACVTAKYLGEADSCDARCELTEIRSCVSGDKCCPAGCDRAHDDDCAAACPEGQTCPMTQVPTTPQMTPVRPTQPPPPPPFVCGDKHAGTACRSCTCAKCGTQIEACLNDSEAEDARLCNAAIGCSEVNKCNADACYCGNVSADTCADMPAGKCLDAWQNAARSQSPALISFLVRTPGYTLNHAVSVIECRAMNCSKECGITP
jgi:hypothetical protein